MSQTSRAARHSPTSCRCVTSTPSFAYSQADEGASMPHTHHPHSHDDLSHLDAHRAPGGARIGIGGPVGSGKTALIEALVPRLLDAGRRPLVVTNDIFTQ